MIVTNPQKEVIIMIRFIQKILGVQSKSNQKSHASQCNYANNYYGDQLCSSHEKS